MAGTYENINLSEECGFGLAGYCCSICQMGPCRINPFDREKDRTACGFSRRQVAVAQLLCCLLAEAGDHCSAHEAVSGIEGHVLRTLGWMGRGPRAGIEEGLGLLIGLSSALLSLRAGTAGSAGRPPEGLYRGDNVYLLEMDDSPANLSYLLYISREKGPEIQDKAVVIVRAGRKSRSLSTVIGLAACGFTVRAPLPYHLLAHRELPGMMESLLLGRIEDLAEGGPEN
ncbi:MAG: hypothetical protein ACYC4H_14790 [Desulfocucumaceae bacterium]